MTPSLTHAHMGDLHVKKGKRWNELRRVHWWIVEDLQKRKPGLITIGGDVVDATTNPDERDEYTDLVMALGNIAPVFVVKGNHDPEKELRILAKLRSKHPIIVEEFCGLHEIAGAYVIGLAWARKAELLANLKPANSDQAAADAETALTNVLNGFGAGFDLDTSDKTKPRILISHAMVRGSRTGIGQPLVGCDFEMGIEAIGYARCDFNGLSHVHMEQEWESPFNGAPIMYAGSTYRTNFGEAETKSYIWVEYPIYDDQHRASGPVKCERIVVPATPMILYEGTYDPARDEIVILDHPVPKPGVADIRLRFRYDSEYHDAAEKCAERMKKQFLEGGAVMVTLDPERKVVVRARMPEISKVTTTADKLQVYWASTNNVPPDAQRAGLLDKVQRLELEALSEMS